MCVCLEVPVEVYLENASVGDGRDEVWVWVEHKKNDFFGRGTVGKKVTSSVFSSSSSKSQ